MRKHVPACALVLAVVLAAAAGLRAAEAAPASASAPELLRIPLIGGLYTAEAPADWHLEERGSDLTAAFSGPAGAGSSSGTLIIAAPNPLIEIEDAAACNRRAAESLLKSFRNGVVTKEETADLGGRPAHTVWIAFKAGEKAFLGWSRTVGIDGGPMQAMAMAPMGGFAEFMKTAEPIFTSCEVDPDRLRANENLLTEIGRKILEQF